MQAGNLLLRLLFIIFSYFSVSLKILSKDRELKAYIHDGFWQPMDTLREKNQLQRLWDQDLAPWKTW